jgi:CRISPR-associated protein Csb2
MPCLLLSLHFHEGRYHGRPEWPPSPARLFQALIAGVAQGDSISEEDQCALMWLESLEPPVVAAPPMRSGQSLRNFVPNNDLDAVGGDPGRISEIRTPKLIKPILFDASIPLLYIWTYEQTVEAEIHARQVSTIADHLYQFGRGVDMAWAQSEILAADEADMRLAARGTSLYRPSKSDGRTLLAVPLTGSLASLTGRYKEARTRFQTLYESKPTRKDPDRKVEAGQVFIQPSKPRFRQISYDSPPIRLLFDLLGSTVPLS